MFTNVSIESQIIGSIVGFFIGVFLIVYCKKFYDNYKNKYNTIPKYYLRLNAYRFRIGSYDAISHLIILLACVFIGFFYSLITLMLIIFLTLLLLVVFLYIITP